MNSTANNQNILKPLKFQNRLLKYTNVAGNLNTMSERGNLKEAILKIYNTATDSILSSDIFGSVPESQKTEKRLQIEEIDKKRIDDYLPIIFNETLVIGCTVFDRFLYDVMKVTTSKEPRVLLSLAGGNDINIKDIIAYANYKTIFTHIQEEKLKNFDFGSIKERVEKLKDIGVDIDNAFKLPSHTQEVKAKYPQAYNFLCKIYERRIDIVHKDIHFLQDYNELENISMFMSKIMFELARAVGRKFDIPNDFEQFVRNPASVKLEI